MKRIESLKYIKKWPPGKIQLLLNAHFKFTFYHLIMLFIE